MSIRGVLMKNRIVLIFITSLVLLAMIIFGIYFLNNFNKSILYTFKGHTDNYYLEGNAFVTGNQSQLNIVKVSSTNKDVNVIGVDISLYLNFDLIISKPTYSKIELIDSKPFNLSEYFDKFVYSHESIFNSDNKNKNYKLDEGLYAVISIVLEDGEEIKEKIPLEVTKYCNNKWFY